jgi:transmembrane carrier protein
LRSQLLLRVAAARTIPASGNQPARLTNTANLLSGALARAAAGFGVMPITVLKVRYESSLFSYTSLAQACTDIYRAHGMRGFFAGFGATAVRDAPYAGLYVLFYEAWKRQFGLGTPAGTATSTAAAIPNRHGPKATAALTFTSGVLAAGLATALTNPFDAIKTRLQLQPGVYGNMVRAGRKMVAEEGWRCLFDGLALRMARKGMSSALAWTVYEELVRRAERRWIVDKQMI